MRLGHVGCIHVRSLCSDKGGGGGWHKASVSDCLPLAAPSGLSPLLILTLCGSERVLVVSMELLDDLSCLTTPWVGCPGDGLLPVPLTRCTHASLGTGTEPSPSLCPPPPPPVSSGPNGQTVQTSVGWTHRSGPNSFGS